MMTGSENRGEKQPGRVLLQTGPGRDAIAKSVVLSLSPGRTTTGGHVRTHYSMPPLPSTSSSTLCPTHHRRTRFGAFAIIVQICYSRLVRKYGHYPIPRASLLILPCSRDRFHSLRRSSERAVQKQPVPQVSQKRDHSIGWATTSAILSALTIGRIPYAWPSIHPPNVSRREHEPLCSPVHSARTSSGQGRHSTDNTECKRLDLIHRGRSNRRLAPGLSLKNSQGCNLRPTYARRAELPAR